MSSAALKLQTTSDDQQAVAEAGASWDSGISEKFHRDGFFGPFKLYEEDEAKEMLRKIRIENLDRSRIVFDNDVGYDRHFDIPTLARHITNPLISRAVSQVLGPDLICWRTEFFPKFPGGRGTEWHQVRNYAYTTGEPMLKSVIEPEPEDMDITVWTAFTDTTIETACMKFLPGSHRKLYYDESKPVTTGRQGEYRSVTAQTSFYGYEFQEFKIDPEWIPPEDEAVSMEMKAGEAVMFTARCVHASHPNSSQRKTRFAMTARYVPTNVQVYPGWREFHAHGGYFNLDKWGCVLVAGEDKYGHNRFRDTDNWGTRFAHNSV